MTKATLVAHPCLTRQSWRDGLPLSSCWSHISDSFHLRFSIQAGELAEMKSSQASEFGLIFPPSQNISHNEISEELACFKFYSTSFLATQQYDLRFHKTCSWRVSSVIWLIKILRYNAVQTLKIRLVFFLCLSKICWKLSVRNFEESEILPHLQANQFGLHFTNASRRHEASGSEIEGLAIYSKNSNQMPLRSHWFPEPHLSRGNVGRRDDA